MPTSTREDTQKEAPSRRKPTGAFDPARRDRAKRKTAQTGQAKEKITSGFVTQDGAQIKALADKSSSFLELRGLPSLDAESRRFLGCMMLLEDSESILGEWEKRHPLVPLRIAISLWQENGRPNLGEFLVGLEGHPKADLIRQIRWVDLSESYKQNTGERFKQLNPEHPSNLAEELSEAFAKLGVREIVQMWTFLPDGSGVCLSTGETMSSVGVDAFKRKAERHAAEGCGARFIPKS
jgi:hypothetical protein